MNVHLLQERRWIIVDNFHAVSGGCGNKLRLPQVSDDFRIFFVRYICIELNTKTTIDYNKILSNEKYHT